MLRLFFSQEENYILPVIKKQNKKVFLIINPQGYGDMIVMTPVFRELKRKFKDSHIICLVSPRGEEVLNNNPHIDNIFLYPKTIKDFFLLMRQLRSSEIDVCFDTQIVYTTLQRLLFPFFVKSRFTVSYKRGGFRAFLPSHEVSYPSQHMVDNYLSLFSCLDIQQKERQPEIFIPPTDQERVTQLIQEAKRKKGYNDRKKVIILHTYSENHNHCWKQERWIALAQQLAQHYCIVFLAPPYEKKYVQDIVLQSGGDFTIFVPENFSSFAAFLSAADCIITIDTSSVHIASALQKPTVIIYGPTISTFWGPLHSCQHFLQKNEACHGKCHQFSPDTISFSKEYCQEYKDPCINYITEQDVLTVVQNIFAKL